MNLVTAIESPTLVKLTVDDFDLLHRNGAFDQHRHAELIEGVIVSMSPQARPHARTANELSFRLNVALKALGYGLEPLIGATVAMPPWNAPEPDITLTSEAMGDGYVPLGTVALAIEVSASTLRYDLEEKKRIYAEHQVTEYWVVDVNKREVHQFWSPVDGGYREQRTVPLAGELRSATLPDLAIDGSGIL